MSQVRLDNNAKALAALQRAGTDGLTTEELSEVAGRRYGARIWDLRHLEGWDIETKTRTGTELARYILHGKVQAGQLSLFKSATQEEGRA